MVSFSCENCGDGTSSAVHGYTFKSNTLSIVLTKKKLDPHRNQCRGASFTCLDCMVHFHGTDYRSHTSCISEAQKYQGHLYREKDNKKDKRRSTGGGDPSQAMIPRKAYVEDVPEGDSMNAVAIVDVPPRAPTPPPAAQALPHDVNVFDFLVGDATPRIGAGKEIFVASEHLSIAEKSSRDGDHYSQHGFAYGNTPLQPSFNRYDSYAHLPESQDSTQAVYSGSFITPGPESRHKSKDRNKSEKSDKKRKRNQVDDLDLTSARRPSSRDSMIVDPPTSEGRRVLHSGLTGGLSRLITDPEFYADRIDAGPTPISPSKRRREAYPNDRDERRKSSHHTQSTVSKVSTLSKHGDEEKRNRHRRRRDSTSSVEDQRSRHTARRAIEYPERSGSVQPTSMNQLVSYSSRAELFLSFINKGPESERGCSLNKVLKRYHRERDVRGEAREEDDKELWKSLRLRRNERGEIVVFI